MLCSCEFSVSRLFRLTVKIASYLEGKHVVECSMLPVPESLKKLLEEGVRVPGAVVTGGWG